MSERLSYFDVNPKGMAAMMGLETYVRKSGLEFTLLELVKMRASQMNGCAHCLDVHSQDTLAAGETPQRLLVLSAWREAPFYTERERAALEWTEVLTRVADGGVSDAQYEAVRAHFEESELVDLTLAIVTINAWNRLVISLGPEAGSYVRSGKA